MSNKHIKHFGYKWLIEYTRIDYISILTIFNIPIYEKHGRLRLFLGMFKTGKGDVEK